MSLYGNLKFAQRFVRSLARKAGEGWGETAAANLFARIEPRESELSYERDALLWEADTSQKLLGFMGRIEERETGMASFIIWGGIGHAR